MCWISEYEEQFNVQQSYKLSLPNEIDVEQDEFELIVLKTIDSNIMPLVFLYKKEN